MTQKEHNADSVWRLICKPVFLAIDFLGVAFIATLLLHIPQPLELVASAVGGALLTIGISLPAALFFQFQANGQHLTILEACLRSGIRSIFASRKEERDRFRAAVDAAFKKSKNIDLLGIAFSSMLDPDDGYHDHVREKVKNVDTPMRILLLKPDCKEAKIRLHYENANRLAEVERTLSRGLPAALRERLRGACKADQKIKDIATQARENWTDELGKQLVSACKLSIRLYDSRPVLFLIITDHSIFVEPYHLGRPDEFPADTSVAGYVPVLEYNANESVPSVYYRSHFHHMWKMAEPCDRTLEMMKEALSAPGRIGF